LLSADKRIRNQASAPRTGVGAAAFFAPAQSHTVPASRWPQYKNDVLHPKHLVLQFFLFLLAKTASSENCAILHRLALLMNYRRTRISTPGMTRGMEWLTAHFLPEIDSEEPVFHQEERSS